MQRERDRALRMEQRRQEGRSHPTLLHLRLHPAAPTIHQRLSGGSGARVMSREPLTRVDVLLNKIHLPRLPPCTPPLIPTPPPEKFSLRLEGITVECRGHQGCLALDDYTRSARLSEAPIKMAALSTYLHLKAEKHRESRACSDSTREQRDGDGNAGEHLTPRPDPAAIKAGAIFSSGPHLRLAIFKSEVAAAEAIVRWREEGWSEERSGHTGALPEPLGQRCVNAAHQGRRARSPKANRDKRKEKQSLVCPSCAAVAQLCEKYQRRRLLMQRKHLILDKQLSKPMSNS
ncbi:hypothetical protein ACER0C_009783 [Sarotherodon galilaeus]